MVNDQRLGLNVFRQPTL